MKINVTLDISPDSIKLDEINEEASLEELGRDDEPFESKLDFLEFLAEALRDDEFSLNEIVDMTNAVVETDATEL